MNRFSETKAISGSEKTMIAKVKYMYHQYCTTDLFRKNNPDSKAQKLAN